MTCKILLILVLLLYLKWILIIIFFPFQIINGYRKRKDDHSILMLLLCAPYLAWEAIFRGGWQRYMLFQVGTIPSNHVRKYIYALLDARRGLTLGNNVNLSSNVSIYTEQHDHRDPYFRCTHPETKAVKIEDRVWLGSNVVVLPGVTIGEGAVCCAGCVVTKDVQCLCSYRTCRNVKYAGKLLACDLVHIGDHKK